LCPLRSHRRSSVSILIGVINGADFGIGWMDCAQKSITARRGSAPNYDEQVRSIAKNLRDPPKAKVEEAHFFFHQCAGHLGKDMAKTWLSMKWITMVETGEVLTKVIRVILIGSKRTINMNHYLFNL
jgi:hypothetical protein